MAVTVTYNRNIVGAEFKTNTFTTGDQLAPDGIGLAYGFVSAYNNASNAIAVSFFQGNAPWAGGHSVTSPAQGATAAVGAPALTRLNTNNILVVWDENDAGNPGIKGRIYAPWSATVTGELALVGGTTPTDPQVAALRDGGFALTYTDGQLSRVAVFNNIGVGGVLPDSSPAGAESDAALAALADGGFVVTYTNGTRMFGRVYNADGSTRTDNLLIDDIGTNTRSKVVGLPNGNWAVVYRDSGWGEADAGNAGITMRIYDATGGLATDGFIHVNTPSATPETDPDIAVLPNGFIVVTWTHPLSMSDGDIYGRVFDQDGNPVNLEGSGTSPFVVTASASNDVLSAVATLETPGQFITSWQDSHSDGSGGQITSTVNELTRKSIGDDADDTIIGDVLYDVMHGGGGNDTFSGGGGENMIDGGAGDDTTVYTSVISAYHGFDLGDHFMIYGPGDKSAPNGVDTLTSVEHLQFADGTVHLNDGSALFDTFFYMRENLDVFHAGANAMAHFNTFGWHEGRDPNALFDTSGYLAVNKDVAAAGLNPLEHYHQSGWKEGRDPGLEFDTTLYLIHNPDVAAAGVDPLEHFLAFGRAEGRDAYMAFGPIESGFDAQYYLFDNPDVAAAGVDPFVHFQTFGWQEGRDPNGWFDTTHYLSQYADVAAAGVNPLEHYLQFGWKEGRTIPGFENYLVDNPDVAAAGINPLEHFLNFGIYEGRHPANWAVSD